MTIEATPEYAITQDEYLAIQMVVDADNALRVFTPEQKIAFDAEIREIEGKAFRAALDEILNRHKVEFVAVLRDARKEALLNGGPDFLEYVFNVATS